jgi:sugar phosphate isomerase/epimerase
MKAGFCVPKRAPETTHEILRGLGRLGYDGVEIWQQLVEAHGVDALAEWLDETGLEVAQVCPYFDFTTSERTAAESLALAEKYIGIAARLRCRRLRTFTSKMGAFGSSRDAEDAHWRRTADGIRAACRMAAPQGIALVLETHFGDGQLCDSTPAVRRLLEEVGEPNLSVNLQPPLQEDPLQSAHNLAPFVTHLHAHNWVGGWDHLTFLDGGDVDFAEFVRILRDEGGFDGYISIEHPHHHPFWEIAQHEIEYIRGLIARFCS